MSDHTCTMFLAGKAATIDGSTIICREEDYGNAFDSQRFVVIQPADQPHHYQSKGSQFQSDLPPARFAYTATPDADDSEGIFAAGGINTANVAMTATETITSNARIRAIDPYNTVDGIGEEDFLTLVLPYISSAREGVERLGRLLTKYGTYEANAIAFSDRDEVWYLETIGGHHWAAVRVPDNAYVIAPNRFNIAEFDFAAPTTMCSADLKDLIEKYQLNPGRQGYNFRLIFGSASNQDQVYNNPRAWYVQSRLGGGRHDSQPTDYDLPFACVPDNRLTVEKIKQVMSSHYQATAFDPYRQPADRVAPFRSIALNRNLELHVLQIRNNVTKELAGIHWLAFGPNTFNALVPFYANVNDTPAPYRDTTSQYSPNNMYWLVHTLAALGDRNYRQSQPLAEQCAEDVMAATRQLQLATDRQETVTIAERTAANDQMATVAMTHLTKLLGKLVALAFKAERLQY
ncbi:C69 family dipeptidase [Limosilactobacillus sp.]|uniref:C69 family dipeptidase n=1 Tax=Limosilactobacillus sp. TaxID=2773925 RepID=UPI003F01DCCC